ncbi:hypothetical protein [Absidia glauca]|uniref:Uncharacterized protein n=1 Tax=Absidia glauca TaxID=4829 RepID=A0A168RG17_ABSGL|nr:hypothetical protein [Absidia glauca]
MVSVSADSTALCAFGGHLFCNLHCTTLPGISVGECDDDNICHCKTVKEPAPKKMASPPPQQIEVTLDP